MFEVESSGTGPENRAPNGDADEFNILECLLLQDMTYMPDLDGASHNFSKDDNLHYLSIRLIGTGPNDPPGIDYGVELDTDQYGFGDFIIRAQPPYTGEWPTAAVQVLADKNHNTSGIPPIRADAPFSSDGYETLLFGGSSGTGDDPDLAWVRMTSEKNPSIQITFKRSLARDVFMAGVLADAGLKDVDRFTEEDAGSSARDKQTCPLKPPFPVDTTCRDAFGFQPSGHEPMICAEYAAPASSSGPNNSTGPSQP